jgi:hypothetical protein
MLAGKLLSLLGTAKGAAAAAVVVAAAAGSAVAATNEDVQTAVSTTVQNTTRSADSSRPAVVASRNDADKQLRDAFHDDQQTLAKVHSTHVESTDRAALNETVGKADAALRDRLAKALDEVAALTLGRNGHESPKPTGSPDIKKDFTAETQAKIDEAVKTAIQDMDKIVKDAEDAVALLATTTPGKPDGAGKPASVPTPPAK